MRSGRKGQDKMPFFDKGKSGPMAEEVLQTTTKKYGINSIYKIPLDMHYTHQFSCC